MPRFGIVVACLLLVSACGPGERDDARLDVVAAFFPIADVTRRIGGDAVDVRDITPAGAEPHDLELTSDALDHVLDADLVIYLRGFQPALDDALDRSRTKKVDLLGLEDNDDPHIWLDPGRWAQAAELIGDELRTINDGSDDEIRTNTRGVIAELDGIDLRFRDGLRTCERDLIVTAHDAFGRLASRYGLRVESIAGVAPEAEPDPRRLAEIADLVRDEGVTTVLTEELVSPEVAEAVADETGARVDVLDPIETEPDGGYEGAMRRNLGVLQEALACG